mmetsp:Transcript_7144/g.26763  ORF Transcript_7144/g.26763 Transcript_7144/m.26763 type:complete len:1188 (-) Transcript_7144:1488-5051(-)|eukprot:CAMPEP_0117451658 /NCGR_PEP_ID=MMETSP0759-20121206/9132_1 /TAXON_ID=63605 /ORGANISM="Percolomonas cosmopolitus, Strain WS" /LENGTH=1187 /DNA_ID=CAMNT_0005244287 /DNA_START=174 /DNA_END=3737 /DNA_ORIENTATION=+
MRNSTTYQKSDLTVPRSFINQGEVKTSVSGLGLYSFSPVRGDIDEFGETNDRHDYRDSLTPQHSEEPFHVPKISPRQLTEKSDDAPFVKASFQKYKFPPLVPFAGHIPQAVDNGMYLDDEAPTLSDTVPHMTQNTAQSWSIRKHESSSKKRTALSKIDTSSNVAKPQTEVLQRKESLSSSAPESSHSTVSHGFPSANSAQLSPIDTPSLISLPSPTKTDSDSDSFDIRTKKSRKRKKSTSSSNSAKRHTGEEPTDLEQSRYYVNTLLSDTARNKRTREKIFEGEIARRGAPPPSVTTLEQLGIVSTKIPDKIPVTAAIDTILGNIGSLMGMSAHLKDSRGAITKKFRRTVLNLEKKVNELQMLINEKDESLQRALKREENTVKALETTLQGALIREKDMYEKYSIPMRNHRFLPMMKNGDSSLSSMVKDRWKEYHDLDSLEQKLWKEQYPIEAIQSELQEKLRKEHEKNTEQLKLALQSFQGEYMALFEQYKSMENRLKFYENDKQYMKKFRGPTGKVTIVFTDVESSTKYWEKHEEQMALSINMHNKLIRQLLDEFHGFEVKVEGDAVMIAFSSPVEAVDFSMQVQLKLLDLDWPEEILHEERCQEIRDDEGAILWRGLRVRIGMHTGFPIVDEDPTTHRTDYFGPMVNKAARVEGFADGGGVCVSSVVWEEIQPYLSNMRTKIWAVYLGKKKMKGIEEKDDIRLLVPASLRTRNFDDSEKASRWDNIFSWKSIQERQKDLEGKMNSMKDEIHHTLHVSALESIIKEKDTVIHYLMNQLNAKNLNPEQLTGMMSHYTQKIQERFDLLSKEVHARVGEISDQAKPISTEKTQKTPSQKSESLDTPTRSRPTSSKSTDGDDKKKKKKRRGSFMKPVEVKSANMEISRETYNTMQHNLKFFKDQRDQAVKKQRNLAMDLLETQTKLHKLTRDVERFKKQVKVGGTFGVASPATDFRHLEKPKSVKVDDFSDSPINSPSPTKRQKKMRKRKSARKKSERKRNNTEPTSRESEEADGEKNDQAHHTVDRELNFDDSLEHITDEEFMVRSSRTDVQEYSRSSSLESQYQLTETLPADGGGETNHETYVSSERAQTTTHGQIQESVSYHQNNGEKSSLLKRSIANRFQHSDSSSPLLKPRPLGRKYAKVASRFMAHMDNPRPIESIPEIEGESKKEPQLKAVKPHLIFFQLNK